MQPPASLWWSTLDEPVSARASLRADIDVDVAIVGGGFTGLWSARELLRRDPSLRVAVLEREVCGFGASGRNGGWASALYPLSDAVLRRHYGDESADDLRRALQEAVVDLGRALKEDGIDAHYRRGGTFVGARNEAQATRLKKSVESARECGVTSEDLRWLEVEEAGERVAMSSLLGATFSPHCARVHPARLVRGLSDVVESLGAAIYENTPVTRILPATSRRRATLVTPFSQVSAQYVLRATEGYTPTLAGERRTLVPLYSLMIASEPLEESFFAEIGLGDYETFADDRNLIIYGQRTEDNRLAFGGRGAPYHFGSVVEPRFDVNDRVFSLLESTLHELFPAFDATITHRWGGALAMPRDLSPFVQVDHESGLCAAGGYTGDGVVLSRVAAIALADSITAPDEETAFTRLPFVHHHAKRWEPEPLRWMGISAGLALAGLADRAEKRTGRESRAGGMLDRLFDQFPP
ncbi:MAG TPA: FAD-dependent oxidoreductase [Acidimicrobiales bacterium]|nr:FAD-dependent oxidoreductase [Acidimicrobiales bacterium]